MEPSSLPKFRDVDTEGATLQLFTISIRIEQTDHQSVADWLRTLKLSSELHFAESVSKVAKEERRQAGISRKE